jgi:hypothetical protein
MEKSIIKFVIGDKIYKAWNNFKSFLDLENYVIINFFKNKNSNKR